MNTYQRVAQEHYLTDKQVRAYKKEWQEFYSQKGNATRITAVKHILTLYNDGDYKGAIRCLKMAKGILKKETFNDLVGKVIKDPLERAKMIIGGKLDKK